MTETEAAIRELLLPQTTGMVWPSILNDMDAGVLALHRQLTASQWWTEEDIWRHQARQLASLCAHAARTVPFYQSRLRAFAGPDRPAVTRARWAEIPVLTRPDIQASTDQLLSTRVPKSHGAISTSSTSGSTGRPITVSKTGVSDIFIRGLNLRYHIWHKRAFDGTSASIRNLRGAQLQSYESGTPGTWIPVYRSGPMHMFPITKPIGEQVDWLLDLEPEYLVTHASNVPHLIAETERRGVRFAKLREVSTMGDCLPEGLRERCRAAWGVPLHDLYSCQETGLLAFECPDHPHYHVQSENVLIEVVDDQGAPCPPGTLGRVLITDLQNFAMPLIRYEIGDYAEAGDPCPCGRGLPVLNRIVGRFRNLLVRPDGQRFYPRFTAKTLIKVAPITQMQLVQRSRTALEARFVIDRPFTADEEDALRAAILGGTDHPFDIAIIRVDDIPRSPGGKYEDVVCLVDD